MTRIHVIWLMNALTIRLKRVSQHLLSVYFVITIIRLSYLGAIDIDWVLLVGLIVVSLPRLLRGPPAWSGWTVVRASVSKTILGNVAQVLLSFHLHLLKLLLYLNLILLTWREVVALLLRLMTIICVWVTWDWLVHAALEIVVGVRILSTKESSLSHSFGLRIDDACLLFWWWTLWLGEVHHSLLYRVICDGCWCAWIVDVVFFVLHLISQSLLKLHLCLHFLLLVSKNRMLTLSIITNHWHLLLLLHLRLIVGLNHSAHKLTVWIGQFVLRWRTLNWIGHRSRVCGGKVLLFAVETSA